MSILARNFNNLTQNEKKGNKPAPFSLRLSFEERTILERAAAGEPLGRYIRRKLLEEEHPPRRQRKGVPIEDHVALARVLSALGESRITNNINQLAKAVNTGSLPITPDTDAALQAACSDIRDIRLNLLKALGLLEGPAP